MAQALLYRQSTNDSIDLGVLAAENIKIRIGQNLKRIRLSMELTQDQVGALCDPQVAGSHIAAIESGGGLRVDMLSRLCVALKIDPSEIYLPENPALPRDKGEREQLDLYRESLNLGIIDQVREIQEIYIERAKKKSRASGKDAQPRSKRIHK